MHLFEEYRRPRHVTGENWEELASGSFDETFSIESGAVVAWDELPETESNNLWLLRGLIHIGATLATDDDIVSWNSFAQMLPHAPESASEAKVAVSARPSAKQLDPAELPMWLQGRLEKDKTARAGGRGKTSAGPGGGLVGDLPIDEPPGTSDETLEALFHTHMLKSAEWAPAAPISLPNFKVRLLGGNWLAGTKGKAYDAWRGWASGMQAQEWCERYKLNKSRRCEVSAYSEQGATTLANAWCHRMQYYCQIWADSGPAKPCTSTRTSTTRRTPKMMSSLLERKRSGLRSGALWCRNCGHCALCELSERGQVASVSHKERSLLARMHVVLGLYSKPENLTQAAQT